MAKSRNVPPTAPPIKNRLAAVRRRLGMTVAGLAGRIGVRRQTIYAIEAGSYLPNTALALRLADALGVPVEHLFTLNADPSDVVPNAIAWPGRRLACAGASVNICRVGDRWVSIPLQAGPYYQPVGDAVLIGSEGTRAPRIGLFDRVRDADDRLVIAGCDPAALVLARLVERDSGVRIVPAAAASRAAIRMVCDRTAHLAGSHLEDSATGEFNLPMVRNDVALDGALVVTLARWDTGLVVAPGNPRGLRDVDDLTRPDVTFVNREPGSGSRALLDKLMRAAGVPASAIRGFDRLAGGHLAAAYHVSSGGADACLATRFAARAFGLGFVPLQAERYDFIVPREYQQLPGVRRFLDVLQRASVRRRFAAVTSYDTSEMGRQVA